MCDHSSRLTLDVKYDCTQRWQFKLVHKRTSILKQDEMKQSEFHAVDPATAIVVVMSVCRYLSGRQGVMIRRLAG